VLAVVKIILNMDFIKKYNIEELSQSQKLKVDKIIKLIVELKKEKVNACVASTPQNKLIFYKADKWLDSMEDIQELHNDSRDFVYEGKKQPDGIIDAVGY
jgi:Fe-S-cluster-containing dehydrogenase component